MRIQPDLSQVSWQEPGSAEAVRSLVIDRVKAIGGRIETDGPDVEARFGSRTSFRLWGLLTATGRAALPVAMTVAFEELDGSVTVDLTLRSDQGFYLIRHPRVRQAYEARFAELVSRLRP